MFNIKEVSIDSIKLFRPITSNEIKLTSFGEVSYYPDYISEDIKRNGMNLGDKTISKLEDEVYDQHNRSLYKIYRRRYHHWGNVLVLCIPNVPYALYENPTVEVNLIDLFKFVKDIENRHCNLNYSSPDKSRWYINRLDIRCDIPVDSVRECIWEFRSCYRIPRWNKISYPNNEDNINSISHCVHFYTKYKSRKYRYSKALKFYNRISQLKETFPELSYQENILRIEYSMQRSKELRSIGIEFLEDLFNTDLGKILFNIYKKMEMISDYEVMSEDPLKMIKERASEGKNVSIKEILIDLLSTELGDEGVERCFKKFGNRHTFFDSLNQADINHNRAWKWWDKLQEIKARIQGKKVRKRPITMNTYMRHSTNG